MGAQVNRRSGGAEGADGQIATGAGLAGDRHMCLSPIQPYPITTPGGGTLSSGTKKSGINGVVGSTR